MEKSVSQTDAMRQMRYIDFDAIDEWYRAVYPINIPFDVFIHKSRIVNG